MKDRRISKRLLSMQVAEGIRDMIIEEALAPGDRLPTEQELADRFGVSRISLREATRVLAFLGVIDSAPKRGMTVGTFDMARVGDMLSFHWQLTSAPVEDLVKARAVIEVGCLSFAMERICNDDALHGKLLALAQELESNEPPNNFFETDMEFHRELVAAGGVAALLPFTDILNTFFQRFHDTVVSLSPTTTTARPHTHLLELLREGRLADAEAHLRDHMQAVLTAQEKLIPASTG